MKVILASGSPRRKELLSKLLRDFEIYTSGFDENKLDKSKYTAEELVKNLSFAKAVDVYLKLEKHYEELVVIGADTVVSFNGKILGKPHDKVDAINTLIKLQSNSNDVYTGMTVCIKNKRSAIFDTVVSKSTVHMKGMTHEQIMEYVNTGEPMDKAGSYAIQGIGRNYVKGYDGKYNTIVGLDINSLRNILLQYKVFEEN